MLLTRIVTAIVLLAVLLPAIFFAPSWAWGLISLVFLIQGAREWGRLLGLGRQTLALTAGLALFGLLWLVLSNDMTRWAALSLCGLALSAWFLFMPRVLREVGPAGPGLALAALSLAACWVALFELRKVSPALLLSAMALVWVADIGAYAGGRLFGKRKLAPRVSPGKTWEGAVTGWLAVCGLALGAHALLPVEWAIWSSRLMSGFGLPLALLLIAATVALSVTGDLFESALKRAAGVKDSSHVLPGHGGVLDRIDALIPAMPAALLLYMLLP